MRLLSAMLENYVLIIHSVIDCEYVHTFIVAQLHHECYRKSKIGNSTIEVAYSQKLYGVRDKRCNWQLTGCKARNWLP